MSTTVKDKIPIMNNGEKTAFRAFGIFSLVFLFVVFILYHYQVWSAVIFTLLCVVVYAASFTGPLYYLFNGTAHKSNTCDDVTSQASGEEEVESKEESGTITDVIANKSVNKSSAAEERLSSKITDCSKVSKSEAVKLSATEDNLSSKTNESSKVNESAVKSPVTDDKVPRKTTDNSKCNTNDAKTPAAGDTSPSKAKYGSQVNESDVNLPDKMTDISFINRNSSGSSAAENKQLSETKYCLKINDSEDVKASIKEDNVLNEINDEIEKVKLQTEGDEVSGKSIGKSSVKGDTLPSETTDDQQVSKSDVKSSAVEDKQPSETTDDPNVSKSDIKTTTEEDKVNKSASNHREKKTSYQVRHQQQLNRSYHVQDQRVPKNIKSEVTPLETHEGPLQKDDSTAHGYSSKVGNTSDKLGRPYSIAISTDNIEIAWKKPDTMTDTDSYQVRFKEVPDGKWALYAKEFTINNGKISGLKTDTSYMFRVRLMTEDGESKHSSEESVVMTTQTSFAAELQKKAKRIEPERMSSPKLYALPIKEKEKARNKTYMTRKYDVGKPLKNSLRGKTIMLLGATGTGKSTLVDGLANYIMGVNFEDPFRFTLASDDDRSKQKNQAISQTDWITCYSFAPHEGTKINYQLNVIDTPGFGDTRGIERDKQIVDHIRYLFSQKGEKGVQLINAVCFLVKAPDARLTATQTYVFQSLVSLFGKDIKKNICTLITFADGSDPPVLDAMKESGLEFGKHFTFNNSALFAKNGKDITGLAPMFWQMGFQSFFAFFDFLQTTETQSLQLTKEVLHMRNRLELTIQNLRLETDRCLSKMQTLKERKQTFEDNLATINDNKDFEYEEQELKQQLIDLEPGHHVTNCLYCNMTCHDDCVFADDSQKKRCCAMDDNGKCTQCPEKCSWDTHKNTPHIIKYTEVTVKKTYKDMLKRYEDAKGKKLTHEQMLKAIQKDVNKLETVIVVLMDDIRKCNNKLKDIALMPNPLDMVAQIDLMITSEKMERREGYQKRIDVLLIFREKAELNESVMKIHDGDSLLDEPEVGEEHSAPVGKLKWCYNFLKSLVP